MLWVTVIKRPVLFLCPSAVLATTALILRTSTKRETLTRPPFECTMERTIYLLKDSSLGETFIQAFAVLHEVLSPAVDRRSRLVGLVFGATKTTIAMFRIK